MALSAADLNIVTVDTIKPDFQCIDAEFFPLADFQFVEIITGAVRQGSPLIQFFIVARGNHTAVTHQYRRRFNNGPLQQSL